MFSHNRVAGGLFMLAYCQVNSRVSFCKRRTATKFEFACTSPQKRCVFGDPGGPSASAAPSSNLGRLLGKFPTFELTCVYRLLVFLSFVSVAYSDVLSHVKKITDKSAGHQIRNVDYIYMINLDERPEKYQLSLEQLAPYGIYPYRFSAVNGWKLSLEQINNLGTPYKPWMRKDVWGTRYLLDGNGEPFHEVMGGLDKIYFSHCMSRGAIGIVLSHLSILQDAYKSRYETIWVMEDDIEVIRNPHIISSLIDEINVLVGKKGWDILFTDRDTKGQDGKYVPCSGYAWRPGIQHINSQKFGKVRKISSNIRQIAARYGAYSMLVSRSGMKKMLDFFRTREIFLPYDMEFVLPDDIRLFTVMEDIVSTMPKAISDNGGPNYIR